MMGLGTHITQTQHGVRGQLTLDGKKVVLVVGIGVPRRRRGHAGLREERREIDVRIRMAYGSVQRWERKRERIDVGCAIRRADERRREQWPSRAGVTGAVRRLRFVDSNRV